MSAERARPRAGDPGEVMRDAPAQGWRGWQASVWVDENYRVTFTFENGHAYEVDYEDSH